MLQPSRARLDAKGQPLCEVLSKMATRLQVAAAQPDDLDAAFAGEAIALRTSLAGVSRTGLHAASVAQAIAGVAASRR